MNRRKYVIKGLVFTLLVLIGIFLFVFGGYDDSPGAQLLGFLVIIFSIISLVKLKKSHKII